MARGIYQNLGEGYPAENPNRAESRFWNQGRWHCFVLPLLGQTDPAPLPEQVFVEIGCNAGLFLRAAIDYGFGTAVGVEKSGNAVRHGRRYRDENNYTYDLRNGTFGLDVSLDDLPVCDVLLLSTVHYYFPIQAWYRMLDLLPGRARNVIFVSRHMMLDHNRPQSCMRDLVDTFSDDRWEAVDSVTDVPVTNDPNQRPDLFSMMFKSRSLKREPIERFLVGDNDLMTVALQELGDLVANGEPIVLAETSYFKEMQRRKDHRWGEEAVIRYVTEKIAMMADVRDHGLQEPILAHPTDHWRSRHLVDGGHRLVLLNGLGHTTALTREV